MTRITQVIAVTLLATSLVTATRADPPSASETVKALRYRVFTAESVSDFSHGGGRWIEQLWFPERKVAVNLATKWEAGKEEPSARAFFQERVGNWSQTRGLETEREQPTEEVFVPRALADRIFALAEATRRAEEERRVLGPLVVEAQVLRTIPDDREFRRGTTAEPQAATDIALSADALRWLAGWAEPVGKEVDPVTRFPKRVKRTKDGGEMVLLPRGPFTLGTEAQVDEAKGSYLRGPSREAELSKPYFMDVDEVTVAQWQAYAKASGAAVPELLPNAEAREPIRRISHQEARDFCTWVDCSVPTEGQWERAARAQVRYGLFANDEYHDHVERRNGLGSADRFSGVSPVGSFPANGWGLRDMAGNVAEWCADWYGPFPEQTESTGTTEGLKDPVGPAGGSERVVKGGSYLMTGNDLSIGHREHLPPDVRRGDVGFRCVRTLP